MPDRAWYYASGGQQRGPVKTPQLKQLATSGELKPDDLVWCDGMANWSPASTVKGLFAAEVSGGVDASNSPATTETLPHETTDSAKSSPAGDHQYREQLQAARGFAAQASREAAGAFKSLVTDPIGGLAPCFAKLGNTRAMQVGVVFVIVAVALFSLAALLGNGYLPEGIVGEALRIEVTTGEKARFFFKVLISAVVAAGAMIGTSCAFRSTIAKAASYHADVFIVGATLLPYATATFLTSLLAANAVGALIAKALLVFGIVFSLLMLFSAQLGIVRLSERTGALATGCIASAGAVAEGLMLWILG
jgi:hypothetical protein